ncbi:hypothetical protein K504DRAFT_459426, partial [Pleomassaria siparia CBS 279.74]
DSICARQTPTFDDRLHSQAEQVRFALYVSQTQSRFLCSHLGIKSRDSFIPMPAESSSAKGLGEELAAFGHADGVDLIVQT